MAITYIENACTMTEELPDGTVVTEVTGAYTVDTVEDLEALFDMFADGSLETGGE